MSNTSEEHSEMQEEKLSEDIEELIARLDDEEVADTDNNEKVSQEVLKKQDWSKFEFANYFEKNMPAVDPEFKNHLLLYLDVAKLPEIAVQAMEEVVRLKLINEAYRARRRIRANDEVQKLRSRLRKQESKLEKLKEERRKVLEELNEQQSKRQQKISSNRVRED